MTMGMVWPVIYDKWKAPLVNSGLTVNTSGSLCTELITVFVSLSMRNPNHCSCFTGSTVITAIDFLSQSFLVATNVSASHHRNGMVAS